MPAIPFASLHDVHLHVPPPVPDTVPQPAPDHVPLTPVPQPPGPGPDPVTPEVIEPPLPVDVPPVREPGQPMPVHVLARSGHGCRSTVARPTTSGR